MSACEVRVETLDNPCGKPATARITYGCVHEHIVTALICAAHADLLHIHDTTCQDCRQQDGHHCPLTARQTSIGATQ